MNDTGLESSMELFSRRRWANRSAQKVKQAWNITVHVLHIILGVSKTQQITPWAETAFISFY